MSELRNVISDTLADRETVFGDAFTNLRTGLTFFAEIQEVQDTELNTELDRDARESVTIHVRDRNAANLILPQDRIVSLGATFQVLRRQDNPWAIQVEFGCMKIVPGKDK